MHMVNKPSFIFCSPQLPLSTADIARSQFKRLDIIIYNIKYYNNLGAQKSLGLALTHLSAGQGVSAQHGAGN